MRFGFALVTHENPAQVLDLAVALRAMFPDCAIACHHDFSRTPDLQTAHFPDVHFVQDFVRTSWGHSSVIDAAVKAFRMLLAAQDPPDWFYLLSGADYPVKSARQMQVDLASSRDNVFLHHVPADADSTNAQWNQLTCRRYYRKSAPHFPEKWRCFAGEHWFTADQKAIRHLLDVYDNHSALLLHYKQLEIDGMAIIPEESYYHTVFCNALELSVANDCLRYIDWTGCDLHPRTLTHHDLNSMLSSNAHFARKFDRASGHQLMGTLFDLCKGDGAAHARRLGSKAGLAV